MVWLNGSVFVDELRGCGFESHCCHFPIITFDVKEVSNEAKTI